MALQVDTVVNDQTRTLLEESLDKLNSGARDKITSDLADLISLGLFSSQINNIKKGMDTLAESHEKFIAVIKENKSQWEVVEQEVEQEIQQLEETTSTNNGKKQNSGNYGNRTGGSSYSYTPGTSEEVSKGTEVKVSSEYIKTVISKLSDITSAILLKKILKENNNESILDLLTDPNKSGILVAYLRKILGDTSEIDTASTAETIEIQKELLKKLGLENEDISTEEGRSAVEKKIMDKINSAPEDESEWNKLTYGENTRQIHILDGDYVVVDTKTKVEDYESYAISGGVRQNANTAEWGSSCLAFAGAHAYDMYAGTSTGGSSAANYAHGGAFTDFMDDDKSVVLAKVFDEVVSGRPVVIQVNGNKQGTSRHFVTVIGFKQGVSRDSITEDDLLILDSWDGKIERMDQENSRFMTSGKDCGKSYSGYRLRVLKTA